MPVAEFERLKGLLPDAAFLDAADVLWRLRRHKSLAEVACLRESARITGAAYAAMFDGVRPGTSEKEAHRAFLVELFRQGAGAAGLHPDHLGSGPLPPADGRPHRPEAGAGGPALAGRRVLLPGLLVGLLPHGRDRPRARRAGGDLSRGPRDGPRPALARRPTRPAVRRGRERVRREFERRRLPWGATSRIGHAIGLDLTGRASLRADMADVFEPGMVLTIGPPSSPPTALPARGGLRGDGGRRRLLTEPPPAGTVN